MTLTVRHSGDVSGNEPSPSIWSGHGINWLDAVAHGKAKLFFDDFHSFGLSTAVASNIGRYHSVAGVYRSWEDTGSAIAQLATDDLGVVSITSDATDDDAITLQAGGNLTSVFGTVKTRANGQLPLAFEARFQVDQITTGNFFVGMAEEGLTVATTDLFTDAGALADKDFIGFRVLEADSADLDFIYVKAGQTLTVKINGLETLAVDTWYKVGFLLDVNEPDVTKRIKIYNDGVEQSTYVTDANIEAAVFPSGEELHFITGMKNSSAAANNYKLDWVRLAQMRS